MSVVSSGGSLVSRQIAPVPHTHISLLLHYDVAVVLCCCCLNCCGVRKKPWTNKNTQARKTNFTKETNGMTMTTTVNNA